LPPSARPAAPPPAAASPQPAPPEAVQAPGPAPAVSARQLRVSVKASVRDPNLLVARPLAEGQALPAGTREALLVMVDGAGDPLPAPGVAAGAE